MKSNISSLRFAIYVVYPLCLIGLIVFCFFTCTGKKTKYENGHPEMSFVIAADNVEDEQAIPDNTNSVYISHTINMLYQRIVDK